MAFRDNARFYTVDGRQLPSVTTVLSVINKPALMHWYAKEERRVLSEALLDVLSRPGATATPEEILAAVFDAAQGVKAGEKAAKKAADIGTEAHRLIEWHTRRLLKREVGPEPIVSDAAQWACLSWQEWVKAAGVEFLDAERVVACPQCGYAGTLDFVALVERCETVGDYKTGGVWPESYLQNVAYRHALAGHGTTRDDRQGIILALPKTTERTEVLPQWVPETSTLDDFLAALRLWRWQRAQGKGAA